MSEQRLENGPKAMSGPEAAANNPSSAHEAARFIATVSLSLGALMLSLFGIIERMVTFEKLALSTSSPCWRSCRGSPHSPFSPAPARSPG